MVVTCPSCQKRYRLEEQHFAGRERFQFACPNCGQAIEAVKEPPAPPEGPVPTSTQTFKKLEATASGSEVPDSDLLAMPTGKRASLAVLQGADSGRIYPMEKTVMVIGRAEADVKLNDGEVSRRHAQIELKGATIVLRDLKSTNGTYVNEQRITEVPLENQTEFRVGATTLMLILTDELS